MPNNSEKAGSPAETTRDPVNQELLDLRDRIGIARLGLMNNQVWYQDPRRLVFTLARYKFVAKMLKGCRRAVEIGCGARVVRQDVEELLITDYDPIFVADYLLSLACSPKQPADIRNGFPAQA